jgi:hypothetical protein
MHRDRDPVTEEWKMWKCLLWNASLFNFDFGLYKKILHTSVKSRKIERHLIHSDFLDSRRANDDEYYLLLTFNGAHLQLGNWHCDEKLRITLKTDVKTFCMKYEINCLVALIWVPSGIIRILQSVSKADLLKITDELFLG